MENAWLVPVAVAGAVPETDHGCGAPATHVAPACQPPAVPTEIASTGQNHSVRVPARKLPFNRIRICNVNVRYDPDDVTDGPSIAHYPFSTVPAVPSPSGPCNAVNPSL